MHEAPLVLTTNNSASEASQAVPHWFVTNYPNTAELTAGFVPQDEALVVAALSVVPYRHKLESFHLRMLGRSIEDVSAGQRRHTAGDLTAFVSYAYLRDVYLQQLYSRFALLSPHQVHDLFRYVEASKGNLSINEVAQPDGLVLAIDGDSARWAATCEYSAQIDLLREAPKSSYKQRQLERNRAALGILSLPFGETAQTKNRRRTFHQRVRRLTGKPITTTTFDPETHQSLLVVPRFDDENRKTHIEEVHGARVVPLPESFTYNTVNRISDALIKDAFDRPTLKNTGELRIESQYQQPLEVILRDMFVDQRLGVRTVMEKLNVSAIFVKTWLNRLQLKDISPD